MWNISKICFESVPSLNSQMARNMYYIYSNARQDYFVKLGA